MIETGIAYTEVIMAAVFRLRSDRHAALTVLLLNRDRCIALDRVLIS